MLTLSLDPDLLPLVQMDLKTSTIRRGRLEYPLGPAAFRCAGKIESIRIREVTVLRLAELGPKEASAEGYRATEDLHARLRRYYPDISASEEVTIVRFERTESQSRPGKLSKGTAWNNAEAVS